MKKIIALFILSISCSFIFSAEKNVNDVLSDVSKFLMNGKESIDSVSFSVTGNLVASEDCFVEKIITTQDYKGFYGDALVIRVEHSYYLDFSQHKSTYYILYSNIKVDDKLKEKDFITVNTKLGSPTNVGILFSEKKDIRITLFSFDLNNKFLRFRSTRDGIFLSELTYFKFYSGIWMFDNKTVDLLSFQHIREADFYPIDKEIKGYLKDSDKDSVMHFDMIHTYRVRFSDKLEARTIENNKRLEEFINMMQITHPFTNTIKLTNYIEVKNNGETIYLIFASQMYEYFKNEVKDNNVDLYFRSLGTFNEKKKINSAYYIVDFQTVVLEDIF